MEALDRLRETGAICQAPGDLNWNIEHSIGAVDSGLILATGL
jgi:hypothetical protein